MLRHVLAHPRHGPGQTLPPGFQAGDEPGVADRVIAKRGWLDAPARGLDRGAVGANFSQEIRDDAVHRSGIVE